MESNPSPSTSVDARHCSPGAFIAFLYSSPLLPFVVLIDLLHICFGPPNLYFIYMYILATHALVRSHILAHSYHTQTRTYFVGSFISELIFTTVSLFITVASKKCSAFSPPALRSSICYISLPFAAAPFVNNNLIVNKSFSATPHRLPLARASSRSPQLCTAPTKVLQRSPLQQDRWRFSGI
jgi:hypothetical protein